MLLNNNKRIFIEKMLWDKVISEYNIIKKLNNSNVTEIEVHKQNIETILDVADFIDPNIYFYMNSKYNDLKKR